MSRKPAAIEMKGGKGLRQRLWDRLRAHTGDFALTDIVLGGEAIETARDYLIGLERAGYLDVTLVSVKSGNRWTAKRWRLARDNGLEAPRVRRDGSAVTQGLPQEQMWRTLRLLKGDTNARELAAHAGTPAVPVAEVAASDYLKNLFVADYLIRTAEGKGRGKGGVQARYRLKPAPHGKAPGPRPPMVCRTNVVYDPNLDKVVYTPPVTEEDAIYGQ